MVPKIGLASLATVLSLSPVSAAEMLTSYYAAVSPEICAHKHLPFDTILQITNPLNGKSMRCRVHDRGPFIRGRSLDVSTQAARALGFRKAGVIWLKVDTVR